MAEFAAYGGWERINEENDGDVSDVIREGCHECGEKAREHCQSVSGKVSPYSYMKFF